MQRFGLRLHIFCSARHLHFHSGSAAIDNRMTLHTESTQSPGVYGLPPAELAAPPANAIQLSPLRPGAIALETLGEASLDALTMLAPPGTLERRHAMALALKALKPGAPFAVLAPNDKGGTRIAKELKAFGCVTSDTAKRHHRICVGMRPAVLTGVDDALADGGPRFVEALGLWSQPGIFSWDRIDPGSEMLAQHLPALSGRGADFGCGLGYLAHAVLASTGVQALSLVDIDRRAIEAAKRNVADPRVTLRWADLREADESLKALNFVVMNAPFHDGGAEDRSLGQSFIARAAEALRVGGSAWIVANRHLPYEAMLKAKFKRVTTVISQDGYKVFEAVR
jgi:16S rRNA (guanine1207-N2)-methyltransferase